jgi:hypothetical protein
MAKNWTKLYKDYAGLWVALKSNETTVVASGKRLNSVLAEARQQGCDQPIVTKIPKKNLSYIARHPNN